MISLGGSLLVVSHLLIILVLWWGCKVFARRSKIKFSVVMVSFLVLELGFLSFSQRRKVGHIEKKMHEGVGYINFGG